MNQQIITPREAARLSGESKFFTGEPCRHGHVSFRDVLEGKCIECRRIRHSKYREENVLARREMVRAWKKRNPEKTTEAKRKAGKVWRKRNPVKAAAIRAERILAFKMAKVSWGSQSKIEQIYAERDRLNALGQEKWEVDHIVPLRSPLVCGLHNEFNLQVITAAENGRKSNKVWPDMPI